MRIVSGRDFTFLPKTVAATAETTEMTTETGNGLFRAKQRRRRAQTAELERFARPN